MIKTNDKDKRHQRLLAKGYQYLGNDGRNHRYQHPTTGREARIKMGPNQ